MDMTSLKLASTISFFARLIFVSPIDILLLISLTSFEDNPTFSSRALISFWEIITSCFTFSSRSFLYFLFFINEGMIVIFVKLSLKASMKSFLGTLAFLTHRLWISLSWFLIVSRSCLAIIQISSNILGLNFKNLKMFPSFSNSSWVFLWLLPFFSKTLTVLLYCLFNEVILLWTSLKSSSLSFSSLSFLSASCFAFSLPGPAEGTSSISSKNPVNKSLSFFSSSLTSWK